MQYNAVITITDAVRSKSLRFGIFKIKVMVKTTLFDKIFNE